jgi:hypothetical protein
MNPSAVRQEPSKYDSSLKSLIISNSALNRLAELGKLDRDPQFDLGHDLGELRIVDERSLLARHAGEVMQARARHAAVEQ